MLCTTPSLTTPSPLDAYVETTIRHKVDSLIGRYGFTEDDRDDLEQDLALHLLQHLDEFDPGRAQRTTFVSRCIEHRLTDLIRHRHRARRDSSKACRFGATSAGDADVIDANSIDDTTADRERQRTDLRLDLSAVIASLSPMQTRICALLPTHAPFAIARELGLSKRAVYSAVAALRETFIAAGLQVYL